MRQSQCWVVLSMESSRVTRGLTPDTMSDIVWQT